MTCGRLLPNNIFRLKSQLILTTPRLRGSGMLFLLQFLQEFVTDEDYDDHKEDVDGKVADGAAGFKGVHKSFRCSSVRLPYNFSLT